MTSEKRRNSRRMTRHYRDMGSFFWLVKLHLLANQQHHPELDTDASSGRNFCASFWIRRHFAGFPAVVSRNVGCFLRLTQPLTSSELILISGSFQLCEERLLCFWLVVPRGKFDSTNQKHYPDLSSDSSSVWNLCARFSDVIWRGNQW